MVNLIDEMRPLFFKGTDHSISFKTRFYFFNYFNYFKNVLGIPDLAIPILEPMSISNITLDVTDASFVAILSNLQIRGLSKFITKSVTYESMQRSKFCLDMFDLRLTINSICIGPYLCNIDCIPIECK